MPGQPRLPGAPGQADPALARLMLGLRTPLMPRFVLYPTGTVGGKGACFIARCAPACRRGAGHRVAGTGQSYAGPSQLRHLSSAEADLDAIEQLHKDKVLGEVDAAVIDKENGKPHVAKRLDRPRVRVIPEWFGGGTLPRKELHELAGQLTASQAGLIAVGEPTIEKALDKALTKADKVVKRNVAATTDEITSELQEALKS